MNERAELKAAESSSVVLPRALPPGATLGVVATSTPITAGGEELIERGYRRLRERGFQLVEAPSCRKTYGHAAGTIQERVEALHDFFEDDGIDGIITFWGGLNTNQLLEYLDWELIAQNPKPLVGYSDVTVLNNAILKKTGLVTFSGPAVITFAKPTFFEYSWRWFEQVLMRGGERLRFEPSRIFSGNSWYKEEAREMVEERAPGWKCYREGVARGSSVGGNLGTFLLLAGTPYFPELKGRILFVEEDEVESTGTIDRLFTQARQVGVFEEIAGLVIGRFPDDVGFHEGDSLEMILDEALKGYEFPVMTGIDFGHTDPLLTIPIGVEFQMDAGRGGLEILEPWLSQG